MTISEYRRFIEREYNKGEYDVGRYARGDKVRFWWTWNKEPELHEGVIEVVDEHGGGVCEGITPSFDIWCDDGTYKHVSIVHIEDGNNTEELVLESGEKIQFRAIGEPPQKDLHDMMSYDPGDWILFYYFKDGKTELHEGVIYDCDWHDDGYGKTSPTLSAECDGESLENIPLGNVVELMSIGFTGDSCILPPKWSNIPGEIVERRNNGTK